jgi:uncharacterized protein (DUF305 family)
MKVLTLTGALVLCAAGVVSAQQTGAGTGGAVPQGLADGPYVHVMATHHEEGIKMANLAATKASDARVKALASRMLVSRQKQLAELKQFMTSVAEDMAPADRKSLKHMPIEKLEQASGATFDRLFLDMMIEHVKDAISLTQGAKLVTPTVQTFAKAAVQQQMTDLKDLETLRK